MFYRFFTTVIGLVCIALAAFGYFGNSFSLQINIVLAIFGAILLLGGIVGFGMVLRIVAFIGVALLLAAVVIFGLRHFGVSLSTGGRVTTVFASALVTYIFSNLLSKKL